MNKVLLPTLENGELPLDQLWSGNQKDGRGNIAPNTIVMPFYAMEAKKNGVKIIAVSSEAWQTEMPEDHFIRHPNKTNLFDYADVCIEDFNPVGDAVVNVPGLDTPIAPVSNIIDFYIAHLLEIECVKQCIDRGITPPVWSSANTPGGDEKNAAYLEKYKPRIKML